MVNVIFFVSNLDSGGLENYLLRFIKEKHHEFNNIYVWCKGGRGGQLEDKYRDVNNVEIVKLKLGYFDFLSYKKLGKFIQEKKIDAVCDFSGNFSGRVILTAKKRGVKKRIASYRSASDRFEKSLSKELYNTWTKRLVWRNATNIVANSYAGLRYFFGDACAKDVRFSVIYNGLNSKEYISEVGDLRSDLGIPSDAFVIGHVGRFNPAKNHVTIVAVANDLQKKYKDIYFLLCGNGVKKSLFSVLEEKGLAERFLIFENRADIPLFLNTMDCFFFPSITEGQPNALIEAMVTGVPFVASNIDPIRETVGDGYELYPPMDINALFNALEKKYLEKAGRSHEQRDFMIRRFDYIDRFNEFLSLIKN